MRRGVDDHRGHERPCHGRGVVDAVTDHIHTMEYAGLVDRQLDDAV